MRLIDADAMHKFVEEKVAEGKDGWKNGVPYEWAFALTAVDMQQAADAEPVRHGRWLDTPIGVIKCSECGCAFNLVEMLAHHCPNCGARMDAEVKDGKYRCSDEDTNE